MAVVVVVVGWYLSFSNVNDPDSDDDDRCRRHGAIRMEVSSSSSADQDSGAVVDSVFGWKREWRAIYSWVPSSSLLSWHVVRVSWVPRPSSSSSRRRSDDDDDGG